VKLKIMPKVFITRTIPEAGINLLKEKRYEVEVSDFDGVLPREQLLEKVKGADAVLALLTDKINAEFFDAAGPQLRIVANFAVGYDNIDIEEAKKRGIITTNTPDVLTESVAEHAIALMFAISRRIVEADKFMRGGKYIGWAPMLFLGNDLRNKTLGLIGLGRIGARVAEIAKNGLGMKVLYFDVKRNEELEKNHGLEYSDLETVLKQSDFISIHVPLLDSTRHLLGAPQFEMMKSTAYLINTSRGPVIDEKALVSALKNSVIKGAGLDVFEEEPKMANGLSELDNVVVVPHIASATEETRSAMSELAAKNIIEVLEGKDAITPIK
jgi:glyoxylate reductase